MAKYLGSEISQNMRTGKICQGTIPLTTQSERELVKAFSYLTAEVVIIL